MDEMKNQQESQHSQTRALQGKVAALEHDNRNLSQALEQQQRFMESVDTEQRKHNLIITGVSEVQGMKSGQGTEATTDAEKINLILGRIDHRDVAIDHVQRLGKPPVIDQLNTSSRPPRPRPLKVVLRTALDRRAILADTKKLKSAGPDLASVYVKKDIHPGVQREVRRLKNTVKTEREKAENTGRDIQYDWKNRCVTVDNMIVDSFQPSFF